MDKSVISASSRSLEIDSVSMLTLMLYPNGDGCYCKISNNVHNSIDSDMQFVVVVLKAKATFAGVCRLVRRFLLDVAV